MNKRPWHSKTLWVNFLFALIALSVPGAKEFISENPDLAILAGALVNMILRFLTKDRVLFLLLLSLNMSCAAYQQLEVDMYYKRDIGIQINGQNYEGVTVVPKADKYEITLEPKGDMDLILVRSCHREHSFEKKSKKFLWMTVGKNKFQYTYKPNEKEANRTCPLRIEVYESINGRHSWALIDFEHPDYALKSKLECDGQTKRPNGVAICQAKTGLLQYVEFPEVVDFADPPDGCNMPKYIDGMFEWQMSPQECLYTIRTADGKKHRMTTVGYSGVLVREAQ